ncbi:MAG: hypothetical protein JWO22_3899 [Frankiales bacterium]|nr:hypothetical protein [Frankiales bacterium]
MNDTTQQDEGIDWAGFRALFPDEDARRGSRGRLMRLAALGLWVAALVIAFLTWNGAAGRAYLPLQLPYFASGGLTAVILTLVGCSLFVGSFLADLVEAFVGRAEE